MAWTLYFLVGITVATASTTYGLHEHSQSTARNAISDTDNAEEVVNRRGLANNNNNIMFRGPMSESLDVEVPENCKKLGICEDVSNYPRELADKIIAELGDTSMLQNDELYLPALPDITQRLGPEEENLELCNINKKYIVPEGGFDSDDKFHYVLNQKPALQSFQAELCIDNGSNCNSFAVFIPGYTAHCVQKYTYRRMAVIDNEKSVMKEIKVPSCCSCLAGYEK